MECIAINLAVILMGIWVIIAVRLFGCWLATRSWKIVLDRTDDDLCMCGATGGSCAGEMSHQFMSTRDYWMLQRPMHE